MSELDRPTFETCGFFEGAYDFHPYLREEVRGERLANYIGHFSRWDLSHARPEIYGFSEEVDAVLPKIHLPYRTTNTVKQVGLQFRHNGRENSSVPDAYSVRYARCGSTSSRGHDITKSLYVDILRRDLAPALAEDTASDDTIRKWQRVARIGQAFGNAVLAFSVDSQSYKPFLSTQGSKYKRGQLEPLKSEALAQAVFDTVYFWE